MDEKKNKIAIWKSIIGLNKSKQKREKIPRKVGETFMETSRGLETSQ